MLTVMPKLVFRTGLSARRPLTGLRKHHAGTTPSSTSFSSTRAVLNRDLALCTKDAFSRPTTHQPSSNDCTTVNCSPRRTRSSSGRTGSYIWRTRRIVPNVSVESKEEVFDMTEKRFWLEVLMKDWRRPAGAPGSNMEVRWGSSAKEKGLGANAVGNASDWRCVSITWVAEALGRRALWGSTTDESTLFLEKEFTWVVKRLKSDWLGDFYFHSVLNSCIENLKRNSL